MDRDIRSMAGQMTYLAPETVPGVAQTTGYFATPGLKLRPSWEGEREKFRGGSGKVVTSTIGTDEFSPWETNLSPDFNHLGIPVSSRFGQPVTTTPGGGTNSRAHEFLIDPDKEDIARFYSAVWGDGYYALQSSYGYFDSLGLDIQRGTLNFTSSFKSRAAQFIDQDLFPVNEVQTLTLDSGPAGSGGFTLQLPFVSGSPTTASIDFDATAAEVKTAIAALSGIDATDVTVTGGPLNSAPFVVTFHGAYAQQSLALMVAVDTFDTGSITVAQQTDGVDPSSMALAPMPANMWDVYIDDAWANLGNTKFGGAYQTNPQFGDKFDRDSPINSSIVSYEKPVEKEEQEDTFSVIIRLAATAKAMAQSMQIGTKQFFRLSLSTASGPAPYYIEGSIPYSCDVDFCAEIVGRGQIATAPNSSAVVLPLTLAMTKDPDSGNYARMELVNTVLAY